VILTAPRAIFTHPSIQEVDISTYQIFIEGPESDGTLEWKSCIEEILAVQD
jgi:hypothetical protein